MPFTIPPDSRADLDSGHLADHTDIADLFTGAGYGLYVVNTARGGGADPTGSTDSQAAFQAAADAVPSNGGKVVVTAGTYKIASTVTPSVLATTFECEPGVKINFTGTGACFRMYGTTAGNSHPGGGITGNPVIDGTSAGAGSCGVHAGDMYHPRWEFSVQNFTGSGSKGAWFDNQYSWMEQATGRIFATNCTDLVVFDNSTDASGESTGSFDRLLMDIFLNNDAAGNGVTFQNGALIEDGRLGIYGNFSVGQAATAYSVLKITGSNAYGYSYLADGVLNTGVELLGQNTAVTSGSNGGEISTIASWGGTYGGNGVLDVTSTDGFPTSGTLTVATSTTTATITYTGVTGTSFTGCAYVSGSATGTVATAGAVALSSSNIPVTISFGTAGSNAIRRCSGIMNFGAHGTFANAVNATNSFQFEGIVNGDTHLWRTQAGMTPFNAGTGLSNGGNIATVNDVISVNPTSNLTGMILPKWGSQLGSPARVTVVNRASAYTITMAASGTSNVASGTSCVILPNTSMTFWWDLFAGLWVSASSTSLPGTILAATQYAPGSPTSLAVNTTTLAAFDSGVVCTGSFTAPASGNVIVKASFVGQIDSGGQKAAFALAASGGVSPVVGNVITVVIPNGSSANLTAVEFYVTGLTPGTAYNLDLLGCAASAHTYTITAYGQTGTTMGSAGGPVLMTVRAA